MEHGRQGSEQRRSMSSATPTKATPAHSWTAACWKAIRTACSKAWRSPPMRSARSRATSTSAPNIRSPSSACETAIRQAERWACWAIPSAAHDFSFHIDIRLGAGAFVCGEETALIASIEGNAARRGRVRRIPPSQGLWGQPTLINNVETFANIAPIIRNGGDWFAGIGTEKSKGTKVFALAGTSQEHRPDRSADGHHPARDSSSRSAAAFPTDASSRPCRPAVLPAAASPSE